MIAGPGLFCFGLFFHGHVLQRVTTQMEWEECVRGYMLQLRVQLMAKAAGTGTSSLRVRIFPVDNHALFKLQVLDTLPSDADNMLPVEGTISVNAAPHEIRATLGHIFSVLQDDCHVT